MADLARRPLTRRRFLALAASAGALTATRAAAQPRARKTGGTLISAKTTEAPSLDPILEQALSRQRIDVLFYNRLVEWGFDGKLEPALAESWTTSPDGRTWTFTLRKGVKFHNGRELVGDDVKFTYERILDPKIGSGGRGYLSAIETIEIPLQPHREDRHQAAERVTPGRHGGRLVVDRAARGHRAEGRPPAHRRRHRPFILQEWMPQSHLKMKRNPDYWDKGKPYRRRDRDQGDPGRGQHHRPAPDGQRPPRAARGQQELPAREGRQAPDRPALAAPRLRHGEHQPRPQAVRRRAGAPGPGPRRRSHGGAAGGGRPGSAP